MKNIFKIVYSTIIITLVMASCTTDDGSSRFQHNPEQGWVEFQSAATTTGQAVNNVQVPVSIEVPIYKNGFTISYSFESVEGDYTQFVNTTSGTVFVDPQDATRSPRISIDLVNMDVGRDFVTRFDVILTATDNSGIDVGVDNTSILRHTITIPCSNPAVLPNDYFVGDYVLADVAATIGPNNGSENFAGATVTLTVDPTNPNRRIFTAGVVPAFNPNAEQVIIEFTTDNIAILAADVDPGLACGAGAPPYIYSTNADGVAWDICSDDAITIPYVEDPNTSCGGPYASSFSLTKVN